MLLNKDQAWEFALLALCIWREARGESVQAKRAVAWTIRNRVMDPAKNWWGDTYERVVLHPFQFSSFNANDPNATKFPGNPRTTPGWQECMDAAEDVYSGLCVDPTGGATHYFDKSLKDNPPKWAATAQFKVEIGNLYFYKTA